MKCLFLDIDGVVNNKENFNPANKKTLYPLDRYCAFLIGKIQLDTGCEVVLSSSWRNHPDAVAAVEDNIVKLYDKTPNLYERYDPPMYARGRDWDHSLRGDEINKWLSKHPEVTRYAILDDDSDFYDDQPLFRTTSDTGITDEIAKQVTEYLNGND